MDKRDVTDLGLFGGAPLFAEPRHVGRPNIGDSQRFLLRCADILKRRWLTNNGPCVQEFEGCVAALTGVPHAVAMCNATLALQVLVRALEFTGEVILPSFTFIATAHALEWEGLTPIFADVDPVTHNLDPRQVERLVTPRTSAIIGVHLWGRPCAVDQLEALAQRHGLKLIFDSAHALGCTHRGRPLGSFGTAEVLSFHATKVANSFEGGVVLTQDAGLADRLAKMRNFGFAGLDQVVSLGTNAKMHEISAAMGLGCLESLDSFIAVNERALAAYLDELGDLPGLQFIVYETGERNNFQYVIAEVDSVQCPLNRDELLAVLQAENVMARRYFYPGCHQSEPYRTRYPWWHDSLPETNRLAQRVLALPTGAGVDPDEIRQIARLVRFALRHAEPIRRHLQSQPSTRAA